MQNTLIQSPARNLERSKSYYESLEFDIIESNKRHFACADGLIIELNTNAYKRPGITLHFPNAESKLEALSLINNAAKTDSGFLISSPAGCKVYIENEKNFPLIPIPKTISTLGNYGGISIETHNLSDSIEFWKSLDFKVENGTAESGWVTLKNETNFSLSIMQQGTCPHLFINPSLNFFNGKKNEAVISKIRELQLHIFEEITHFNKEGKVDNIIIQDPGGLGAFIFND